jgi:hypothetical protein
MERTNQRNAKDPATTAEKRVSINLPLKFLKLSTGRL